MFNVDNEMLTIKFIPNWERFGEKKTSLVNGINQYYALQSSSSEYFFVGSILWVLDALNTMQYVKLFKSCGK